jgi:septum formation protein
MTGGARSSDFARRVVLDTERPLVLASASPRRRELLLGLGIDLEVRPADVPETIGPDEEPGGAAERLARAKARAVADQLPGRLVVAADTVVAIHDRILGKPLSREEAREMLSCLSGATHVVHTGVCVALDDRAASATEATRVTFRPLSRDEIEAYLDTDEPYDKAGAYGAQAMGAAFVSRYDGCYTNVVGLPLVRVIGLIRSLRDAGPTDQEGS